MPLAISDVIKSYLHYVNLSKEVHETVLIIPIDYLALGFYTQYYL